MNRSGYKLKNCIDKALRWKYLTVLYLAVAAVSIALLAFIQPFGDPPDEINRFKVVYFIAGHGVLPNGYDEEILLAGYGGSYAFQPILSYIIMGYLIRFLKLFTESAYILLVAARLVNLVFGVVMAYYVLLIARKFWEDPVLQWLFACMVTFLPMNLFVHSYVNTDSMALLSSAIIVYGMVTGEENNYGRKTCILLGVGVVLCIMSYYNAYAIVLVAMLWFFVHYIRRIAGQKAKQDAGQKESLVVWKEMLQNICIIGGIILVGAGWWFVRNGILYHGDFLGMAARTDCAIKTALPEYNPLTRFTFYGAGLPISAVFAEKQYAWLTFESLIAMFGPMSIPTHGLIYIYYKRLVIISLLAVLLPECRGKLSAASGDSAGQETDSAPRPGFWERKHDSVAKLWFGVLMVVDCLITMGLHLYYSYTWEYQPQGRYLLPMIIPAGYLMVTGIKKLCKWLERITAGLVVKVIPGDRCKIDGNVVGVFLALAWQGLIFLFIGFTYAYTLFNRVLPVYLNGSNLIELLRNVPFGGLREMFW